MTTFFPRWSARWNCSPVCELKVKSGAGSPTFSVGVSEAREVVPFATAMGPLFYAAFNDTSRVYIGRVRGGEKCTAGSAAERRTAEPPSLGGVTPYYDDRVPTGRAWP